MDSKIKHRYLKVSIAAIMVNALLFSAPSSAQPTFEWNPSSLTIEQMQGTQSSHVVTVKASEKVEGVITRIVPELQKWVTVSPASIGDVKNGQSIQLIIAIKHKGKSPGSAGEAVAV